MVMPKYTFIGGQSSGRAAARSHPQRYGGDGDEELDQPLDEGIGGPAIVTRHSTEYASKDEANGDPNQADGERNTGGPNIAGEEIPSQIVGAKQKHDTFLTRDSEQVEIHAKQAEQSILIAAHEEGDRVFESSIHGEPPAQRLWVALALEAIHKGRNPGLP